MTKRNPESLRSIRSDKKIRVNPSISQENMKKLERLALACNNIPKTQLAAELIEFCLYNEEVVKHFQNKVHPSEREFLKVIFVLRDGVLHYDDMF